MPDAVLAAEGLVKRFRGRAAVDGATLAVPPGSIYALLGPNGAGKTTLMRCALGLVRPTGGALRLLGHDAWTAPPAVRARVGALIASPGLVGGLSARANLVRHARLLGQGAAAAAQAAEAVLAADGLARLGRTPARRLSRGEQQRVALAAAFLGDPELLVLDEPTEGLDPLAIAALRDRLAAARAAGRTVVLSSHLLSEVEQLATHCAVIADGRVRVEGAVADLGGGQPRLQLRATPPERALAVCAAAGAAAALGSDGRLTVTVAPAHVSGLVAGLVAADVAVAEVVPVRTGLEAIYRAAIGAPQAAA